MLEQLRVFVNAGHSEYWDAGDRDNVTAARDAGVNLAFLADSLMWWKTHWATSQDNNEPYRTLITYKESVDTTQSDPTDPPTWTGNWRDPRFSPPGDGGRPENAVTGQLWTVNCCFYADQVPAAYSNLRIWRNTAVANLSSSGTYTMPDETLGYEWDSDLDNGFRPAGEIDMSKPCEDVSQLVLDPRSSVGPGHACNSLTLYRASGGALVFDAGIVQWAWGLNANHDGDQTPTDPVMQQATVNLLADMGAQPGALDSGLTSATASTDTTPPTSFTPASSLVASTTYTATVSGAQNTSGTPMSSPFSWSFSTGAVAQCPCSIWQNAAPSGAMDAADTSAVSLGVQFKVTSDGTITGVRFYKEADNTGTHVGSLWTAGGTLLATGTFTCESGSGWQEPDFSTPVAVTAGTTYVSSYHTDAGHYAITSNGLASAVTNGPLTALASDGVYAYGAGDTFPANTFNASNYWVDVVYSPSSGTTPPVLSDASTATVDIHRL